uniref:Uncharacterized protein n=1 Tax=viral metagenome TaxID=1070528 RepID=A0A6M3X4X8_9ZZZZ
MLDYNEMVARQESGNTKVDGLQGDELDIIKHWCSMVAQELMAAGSAQQAPFGEVVINGIKAGLALGLEMDIVQGELMRRKISA